MPSTSLRVLLIEDLESDAELMLRELRGGGVELVARRVATVAELRDALKAGPWDVVLADYSLPSMTALDGLQCLLELGLDLPFIIVSGTVGEEVAVAAMKAGAHDYVMKSNLKRLGAAVQREVREAGIRAERNRAESELYRTESLLRAILNGVGDAVIGLDAEQRIASINPAGITLFGYEEAELIGQSLAGVLRADRRPPLGVRKDGSRFEAEVTLNPIRLGERRMSIAVVRDVSALHELQARLIASDRMASIGALAAGIVHEINNPLGAVTGNIAYVLQRLVGHVDAVGADTLRALEEAREGADRVARIARDVSALSQREGPADREVDLHEVLESVLRLARPEVERHARLVWQEGSPSSAVEGGRARVGQLLLNLLLYAGRPAEDSPEPRTPRPRTLTVSCRETHGQSAVVEVVDSERSVSEEVRRLMFDPFSAENRVSEAATFNLTVCQRLLTEIGGDLEVDNRPEGGSAFRVRIPAPKLPS